MKSASFITLLTFILVSTNALSLTVKPRVIYGIDDRMDVFESSDSLMKNLARSVAVQILDHNLTLENDVYQLDKKTLADEGMCKTERFVNQPAAGNCSGFLIAPDVLVTAGHCVRDVESCQNHYWIFDYANYNSVQTGFSFTKDQMFRCTEIISRVKENGPGADFAVVRIDRAAKGRTPFNFRKSGTLNTDAVLTIIGFPSGIPLKITTGAVVRDNSNPSFFVMNSDTYGGNSGSAVIDTRTGSVEGILVRGDTDYEKSATEDCYVSVNRSNENGRGEDATRITLINKH